MKSPPSARPNSAGRVGLAARNGELDHIPITPELGQHYLKIKKAVNDGLLTADPATTAPETAQAARAWLTRIAPKIVDVQPETQKHSR
jgi:hypothetical protein